MSEMLRDMFFSTVKDKLYTYLKSGPLRESTPQLVYKFADNVINDRIGEIDSFLASRIVRLENISESADYVVNRVLIPYIRNLRVE